MIVKDLPHEVWRDVVGFEGQYMVSSLGRVKRVPHVRIGVRKVILHGEKLIKQQADSWGYMRAWLGTRKNGKCYTVHRLVAIAFLPNPNNLPQINHKNSDKQDNRVENLEWCTPAYNSNYGDRLRSFVKTYGVPVAQYSMSGEHIMDFEYAALAARAVGGNKSNILAAAHGVTTRGKNGKVRKHLSAYGYKWKVIGDVLIR